MINIKKLIDADTISLGEIGWTESRNDTQIKKYVKSFIANNYEKEVDDDLAFILVCIINDLLSGRKDINAEVFTKLREANPYPGDIFPERSPGEHSKFNTALAEAGIIPDGFFGAFGRDVWNQCIEKLIELMEEAAVDTTEKEQEIKK